MSTFTEQQIRITQILDGIEKCVFGEDLNSEPQPEDILDITEGCLRLIAEQCGTTEYIFNYVEEKFVELYGQLLLDGLKRILETHSATPLIIARRSSAARQKLDIAFCAYYALSLIYKKENNLEALAALADEENSPYGRCFQSYPLRYEVYSRYYKRIHNYTKALHNDTTAIELILKQGCMNYGPMISYASTVCRMLEQNKIVSAKEKECAAKYIESAIEYNPDYCKYWYLKGKLNFYSNLNSPDAKAFTEACKSAIEDLRRAQQLLDPDSEHFLSEEKQYTDLIAEIHRRSSVFDDLTDAQAQEWKEKILSSDNPTLCAPPLPRVDMIDGQKYIFICYCSKDFKSVYCDLLELYRLKVPFLYDKGLKSGQNWDTQVAKQMENENCIGALFFFSGNTVLSEAVEREIEIVREKQRKMGGNITTYFGINLEGKLPPSGILIKTIRETPMEVLEKNRVNDLRMKLFLDAFPDKGIFTARDAAPDSRAHIMKLYSAIHDTFPALDIPSNP